MASRTTLTVVFGYAAAFWCLQLLREDGKAQATPQTAFPRRTLLLAVAATTFELTSLLLCTHVRALGRADATAAAGATRRRFLDRLASATLGAATVALLLGAVLVLRLVADSGGWINTE